MDKSKQQEISTLISQEIKKTEQAIIDYKEMTKPIAPENSIGRISRMDAIHNKSVVEAALREAESKLNALNHMITKVDNDDFGICSRCKQPIPFGRLLLMPQSPYCVNCAR